MAARAPQETGENRPWSAFGPRLVREIGVTQGYSAAPAGTKKTRSGAVFGENRWSRRVPETVPRLQAGSPSFSALASGCSCPVGPWSAFGPFASLTRDRDVER